jgi:hypothetical protein
MINPGEIYLADFPQAGHHPVIVVSREDLNRGSYPSDGPKVSVEPN